MAEDESCSIVFESHNCIRMLENDTHHLHTADGIIPKAASKVVTVDHIKEKIEKISLSSNFHSKIGRTSLVGEVGVRLILTYMSYKEGTFPDRRHILLLENWGQECQV